MPIFSQWNTEVNKGKMRTFIRNCRSGRWIGFRGRGRRGWRERTRGGDHPNRITSSCKGEGRRGAKHHRLTGSGHQKADRAVCNDEEQRLDGAGSALLTNRYDGERVAHCQTPHSRRFASSLSLECPAPFPWAQPPAYRRFPRFCFVPTFAAHRESCSPHAAQSTMQKSACFWRLLSLQTIRLRRRSAPSKSWS